MTGAAGSVLVVGSVNADLVVGVDRRPAAGETVLGSDLATFPGGKGANQAVAAARLGASVAFLRRLGTDSFAPLPRRHLHRHGVATGQLGAARPDPERARPVASATALLARGPRSVVITLGADGAYAADAGGGAHVRSPKVTVADTTGAGDAFTGALAWRLSLGDTLPQAAAFAVRVGAAAVTGRGAQGSYPTRDQVPS